MPEACPPLVACLCAAWCGSCREYQPLFARLEASFPEVVFAWVDIEDHADVVGDIDVEDFPTLLIAIGAEVVFLGPVTPHLATAERLLRSALDGALNRVRDAGAVELAGRVRRLRADEGGE
ncbi:thioredoxin family protein [Piscinibacter koreensis]|uniref:Thioredoxin family protein n=1 Tax=Piscinibacter koreensis TaxID=2742824 RepID=A0A7Y6TV07_9BURK|nr:thioredoxin family protein [Schlegelella koreensis]NUZ04412.1 thioredoxin family protein [Schlegelella koreensis]